MNDSRLIRQSMNALLSQLNKIPDEVYKIDAAMNDLYAATEQTAAKYDEFLISAIENSRRLGSSVTSLIEQTTAWAKSGFSLEQSAELAKLSSVYENINGVDGSASVLALAAAMKAFRIEAGDSISIIDSLYTLSKTFMTESGDLEKGLKNSAETMAAAGNDLHQTLALLTGGGEAAQSTDALGNALTSISLRLRGMKEALAAIGEEYENVLSVSELQEQILSLSNGRVNILNTDGTEKSTYEQLREISDIYFTLSKSDQASLTELLFGTGRAKEGLSILNAFQSGQIQKAYEASVNASGSAFEAQAKWMESLEAKTQQFEAAFQSLSNTLLGSDALKAIVDFGTGAVSALDAVTDKIGVLSTLGMVAGAGLGMKNVGRDETILAIPHN